MPILAELGAYIETNSTATFKLGGSTGNLQLSIMDDTMPNTVVVLYETGGSGTAYTFSTGAGVARAYEQPTIQVLSRSTSYQTARNNAGNIYDLLDGLSNTTMTGVTYLSIEAAQPPFSIGRDENNRHRVSVNFNIRKQTT